MSIRAHLIKKYEVEYGDCLGYNNDYDRLSEDLDNIGVDYNTDEYCKYHYVDSESIKKQFAEYDKKGFINLTLEEKDLLIKLNEIAIKSAYAEDEVMIEWF